MLVNIFSTSALQWPVKRRRRKEGEKKNRSQGHFSSITLLSAIPINDAHSFVTFAKRATKCDFSEHYAGLTVQIELQARSQRVIIV